MCGNDFTVFGKIFADSIGFLQFSVRNLRQPIEPSVPPVTSKAPFLVQMVKNLCFPLRFEGWNFSENFHENCLVKLIQAKIFEEKIP